MNLDEFPKLLPVCRGDGLLLKFPDIKINESLCLAAIVRSVCGFMILPLMALHLRNRWHSKAAGSGGPVLSKHWPVCKALLSLLKMPVVGKRAHMMPPDSRCPSDSKGADSTLEGGEMGRHSLFKGRVWKELAKITGYLYFILTKEKGVTTQQEKLEKIHCEFATRK